MLCDQLSLQLQTKSSDLFAAFKSRDELNIKLKDKEQELEFLQTQINLIEDEKYNENLKLIKI